MSYLNLLLFFVATLLLSTCGADAQVTDAAMPISPARIMRNTITINFPNYTEVESYPGISIAVEYLRYFGRRDKFSGVCALTRLLTAGTAESKEYYAHGYRANISANLFGIGANYYPLHSHHAELGLLLLSGTELRVDSYRPGRDSGPVTNIRTQAAFFTPQLHAGFSYLAKRGFILTVYGDFGAILAGNEQTKTGNYGVVGLKLGWRF